MPRGIHNDSSDIDDDDMSGSSDDSNDFDSDGDISDGEDVSDSDDITDSEDDSDGEDLSDSQDDSDTEDDSDGENISDSEDGSDYSHGTPAQDDDETTSTTESFLRMDRTFSQTALLATQDYQSFYSILSKNFNMEYLKDVLGILSLKKSGKKADLVERLAQHMHDLASQKNYKVLNMVIEKLNLRIKNTWPAISLAHYPDSVMLAELLEKSKSYQFNINLPAGYKIEKYVSHPVYVPLGAKEAVNQIQLDFIYTGPTWSQSQPKTNKQIAALVLRIHKIKENPTDGSVKYRFSFGSRISGTGLNGRKVLLSYDYGDKLPMFPLREGLKTGMNMFSFVSVLNAPYYIQVVEISHDPTAQVVIPSETVKKAFLDRARLSEIQASSIQLSLRCPLSLVRIKTPVRFESCKHLQCMELDAWTSYSSAPNIRFGASGTKPCPICNSSTSKTIVIDGYFAEILKGTNDDVDMVTVDVENDLKWSANLASSSKESISLNPEAPAIVPSSPIALFDEPVVIDLTEDNRVYDSPWVQPARIKPEPALPAQHLVSTLPATRPSPSAVGDDFVDLTSDSPHRPNRLQPGVRGAPRPFVPIPEVEIEIIEID